MRTVFVTALLIILYSCGPGKKPKPPLGPLDPPHKEAIVIKGTVLRYESNDAGDIDKMAIEQDDEIFLLHFPPHTAQQVLSIATIKSSVSVMARTGKEHKDAVGRLYELISITTNGSDKMIEIKSIPPPPPEQGEEVEITGTGIEIKKDAAGRTKAFILSGRLIAVPPHAADNLEPLLNKVQTITVRGNKRNASDGFVNSNGLAVIKPYSITINGTIYLIE